ncbi:glycogen synthase GlgA [Burkholderia sp. Bp9031]|uniref:glycogen synthase GlgA n=1 Tax=Burkholderia sp. Bp9031 TaxID=2184566 RepID=UPI000F5E0A2C|nr:glycogen synthase GlgA [Burkholderia sp. Bp9031]RQZ08133.1 glycogen synthase GlgA [Burkholderia sp. Bp9031]
MRVLHVCTEVYPLLKTGGLADVTGALPAAQAATGCDARLLVPGFPAFRDGIRNRQLVAELPSWAGSGEIRLYHGLLPDSDVAIYMVDAPGLYDRPGGPYADADKHPYGDNHRRFALLGWVAARVAHGLDAFWRPNVVHCHDWHAGLAPAYLRAAELATGHRAATSVLTVHNLAYQGVFPAHTFGELDLPGAFFDVNGLEFYGQVSFLKAGLYYADRITTVSPTYASEIQSVEQGCGLHGLLLQRAGNLSGILNGVDESVWNPATDPLIAATYAPVGSAASSSLPGKLKCKAALQQEVGLAVQTTAPLFGIVSRLTEQKGLPLMLAALPELVRRGGQLVLLGSGDAELERAFREMAAAHPGSVAVTIGYDEAMSHRIVAGSDVIVVPSRFEPCGLTQLYGLKYGTLPLVRRVGGLADTVVDCSLENIADATATGFVFDRFDAADLDAAIRRVFALFGRKADWKQVQKTAMRQDFGWDRTAAQFLSIYQNLA